MAYVTIMDECLDGKHEECARSENVPEVSLPERYENDGWVDTFSCGGGMCICKCHYEEEWTDGEPDDAWRAEVRERSIESRAKRESK